MNNLLALDVGTRRTGVAFCDAATKVPVALETIEHESFKILTEAVVSLVKDRDVGTVVIGLPLLPSGEHGSQTDIVKNFGQILQERGFSVVYQDERYTTEKSVEFDGDAAAACKILGTYFDALL